MKYGVLPQHLILAIFKPIHKKGNETEFNHYRPINVLISMSKQFEILMTKRIMNFLINSKIINHNQHARTIYIKYNIPTCQGDSGGLGRMKNCCWVYFLISLKLMIALSLGLFLTSWNIVELEVIARQEFNHTFIIKNRKWKMVIFGRKYFKAWKNNTILIKFIQTCRM